MTFFIRKERHNPSIHLLFSKTKGKGKFFSIPTILYKRKERDHFSVHLLFSQTKVLGSFFNIGMTFFIRKERDNPSIHLLFSKTKGQGPFFSTLTILYKRKDRGNSSVPLLFSTNGKKVTMLQYTYYLLQTEGKGPFFSTPILSNASTGIILQCSCDPLLAKVLGSFFSTAATISKRNRKNRSPL
jgi:hypothetical protein